MADPTPARRRAVMLVVLGIIAFVVAAYLLVAWSQGGDKTDEIDPQNNSDSLSVPAGL
jgi:hypothetical protein